VPRYASEPEEFLHNLPWSYPKSMMGKNTFDYEQDKELMRQLKVAIQARL
jgi:hypothetical protein